MRPLLLLTTIMICSNAFAHEPWNPVTYPDEPGFQQRRAATLPALAQQGFGRRSLAKSACPDTGLPVYTYAVEGEEIISPYTGRRYPQGPTGYFGPKERDEQGRIVAFGGDPLKFDLPPATAQLLLEPGHPEARAFLSIPGNLRQQYHFAAINWARFYPLLAHIMPEEWREQFAGWVAKYREERKPSDGEREHQKPRSVHDLVGEEGELLGGDVHDGGTENHKTQWRTSGLLYAQILGAEATISHHPAAEAERIITRGLREFMQLTLRVGNGEWDSSTYYPYSISGYLNLYDFSPKPATRDLAKLTLDYFIGTYGLKVFNGTFIGPQKRGFVPGPELKEMDTFLWAYVPETTLAMTSGAMLSLHQATTSYRPSKVISNIISKNIPLPFEAQIARPTYHMRDANAFQETFYCDTSFAIGSIAMTMSDNAGQQTVWSLGVRGPEGTVIFGGGQPRHRSPEGHSPYTQVLQKRSALLLLTASTAAATPENPTQEQQQRFSNAREALTLLPRDLPLEERWAKAPTAAESWLFVPRIAGEIAEAEGVILIDAGEAFLIVRPIGDWFWIDEQPAAPRDLQARMERYRLLVVRGETSGYVIDVAPKSQWPTAESALRAVADGTALDITRLAHDRVITYRSLLGDEITMQYQNAGLRADGSINGEEIDWAGWAAGGVYLSPVLTVKDGIMTINDGAEGYTVNFRDDTPRWSSGSP